MNYLSHLFIYSKFVSIKNQNCLWYFKKKHIVSPALSSVMFWKYVASLFEVKCKENNPASSNWKLSKQRDISVPDRVQLNVLFFQFCEKIDVSLEYVEIQIDRPSRLIVGDVGLDVVVKLRHIPDPIS